MKPHVVLVDGMGQCGFSTGEIPGRENIYVQVVVSAARQFRGLGHEEVQDRVVAELRTLFPQAKAARLLRARVVTDQAATFSAVPGVDRWRPVQASPLNNLLVAGAIGQPLAGPPRWKEQSVAAIWPPKPCCVALETTFR